MSDLVHQLIAENKKTHATFLDLGNCGITIVPEEIGSLVWLEYLSFASGWIDDDGLWCDSKNTFVTNNITQLNSGFHFLTNLKKLQLNCGLNLFSKKYDLTDLSPLAELNKLQVLDIRNTNILDLSPLAGLSNLQNLNISKTPVFDLSPLSSLRNVTKIDLNLSSVCDLSSLASLTCLKELIINKTQLSDLSPLGSLTNLLRLDACNTKVSDLYPLEDLNNLLRLDLQFTLISDLKPLAGLNKLRELYVGSTLVCELSPLAGLKELQKLDVGSSSVIDLEPLTRLTKLQMIDISYTKVSNLAPLASLMEKGLPLLWEERTQKNGIYILNCSLVKRIPTAIVKQGTAHIANYFREKNEQGVDYLYEAKLLLVGDGRAGKTSLLRRLYQPDLPLPNENETTKGIVIHHHEFNLHDSRYPNGRKFRLNVWDFGGQEIYYATHQFFFTQRSLYVLLDDTSKNHKTIHDEGFKYWLEAVDLLSNHSPMLIFQNEKGGRSKNIDFAGIKSKFDNVKECYHGNLDLLDSVEALYRAIEFTVQELPHIGEELPKQWLTIRTEIEQIAQANATISQKEYFDIYAKHLPLVELDRSKALRLSRYLHDLGVFLHFQDDKLLARTIILQNHWATEAVFKILDDEKVKTQLGRFSCKDCERLWQDSEYADLHPELLALMQKFELCYLLPDTKPENWLVPQLLLPSKPVELDEWGKSGDLVLRFCYQFLPKGLISRLMVRQNRLVPHPELGWLSGVLFEYNKTQVLVEIPPKGDEIVLRARGNERKELLSVIGSELDAINATFKGLPEKITKLVPCYCEYCSKQIEPAFFEQQELLRREKDNILTVECKPTYKQVNVLRLLHGIQIQVNGIPSMNDVRVFKRVFISYSKHDNSHKKTLLKHLTGLRNKIITWNDRDILAGEDWDVRIKEELYKADVVLYLVSHNNMATDYIQNIELPLIEQRCNKNECILIPVIVDFCYWDELGFAKKNALPKKGIPVTDTENWINENQAWLNVIKGIEQLFHN